MQLQYLRAQSHLILSISFLYKRVVKGRVKSSIDLLPSYLQISLHTLNLNAFSSADGAEPRGRRTDWGHFYLCRAGAGAGAGAGERRERWWGEAAVESVRWPRLHPDTGTM